VTLQPGRTLPPVAVGAPPLEVLVVAAEGADPLRVQRARIVYGGVTEAARLYINAATASWAARHARERPGGWQMTVELYRAGAVAGGDALTVELEARVTLRATVGRIHIGQTTGYCRATGALDDDGATVIDDCLERMGRDLAGWLEGQGP